MPNLDTDNTDNRQEKVMSATTTASTSTPTPPEGTNTSTPGTSTSTATANTSTPPVVELPEGHAPCRDCGVAVVGDVEAVPLNVQVSYSRTDVRNFEMGTCPDCIELRTRANVLVGQHPEWSKRIGNLAPYYAANALMALAALGQPLPGPDVTPAQWATLTRLLGVAGDNLPWRYLPEATQRKPAVCASAPWSAVPADSMVYVRESYAQVLAEAVARSQPPVQVTPPDGDDSACMVCGIGSVQVSAVSVVRAGGLDLMARRLWSFRTSSAGSGWCCPTCNDVAALNGGVSISTIETALVRHLGLGSVWIPGLHALDGLKSWQEARRRDPDLPPNSTPWGHLSDLDGIRADLIEYLGVPGVHRRKRK